MKYFVIICILLTTIVYAKEKVPKLKDKDMMRKMIVYDKKNPDIFYCPTATSKYQTSIDKMIVKAHSINKLCEYEGNGVPLEGNHRHDCYQDVDETDFACKEKYRIMKLYSKYS
ncbi:hypothetical protein PVAND_006622 [Polypedilum vanderplanki]|uniref:Secreted protein n=1 Tax=Polypedilum vanderplanki TaxID=319348 RepID=A0A9J6C5G1_POLVA|nr:hypothetical protein PVAND_006622 [Polypedilum vanderplanki]